MPTNPAIEDRLVDEAMRLGRHRSEKVVANATLATEPACSRYRKHLRIDPLPAWT